MFKGLFHFFDPHERQLVLQSTIIGVVVWTVVYLLKTAVQTLDDGLLAFLDGHPYPRMVLLIVLSLLAGALIVATLSKFTSRIIHYRSGDGRVHQLLDVEGDGLERAISLYYTSEPTFEQSILGDEGVDVRWRLPTISLAVRKFIATLATLGSGGSGGLEASVTLIGESLAAGLYKPRPHLIGRVQNRFNWWRPTDPDDLQTAQLSGIAAAIATLIGAPFTAAFFATEVVYRKRPVIEKLIYSLISALVAFFLNNFAHSILSGNESVGFSYFNTSGLFEIGSKFVPPLGNWHYYVLLVLMTMAIALVSTVFSRLRTVIDDGFHRQFQNIWLRHATGALLTSLVASLVVGLVALIGRQSGDGAPAAGPHTALALVLGTGEGVIDLALAGELVLGLAAVALVAKMLATMITIGSGGSAGLLVPSLYFGTMVAAIVLQLPRALGLSFAWDFSASPLILIAPAMTASLVSIANVPLAAIMFAVEVFSGSYIIPSMISLVIAALVTHQTTIYRTQRETFAKRQILPGYGARRIQVPESWHGKTLMDLRLRQQFDVNVIGWVDQEGERGLPRVRLSADAGRPLSVGDILVVVGREESTAELLAAIEAAADGQTAAAPATDDHPDSGAAQPAPRRSTLPEDH